MKKLQLYLETSVWNFYFADDAPEKREITVLFFERVKQGEYEIFISDAVISEIAKARREKELLLLSLIKDHRPNTSLKGHYQRISWRMRFMRQQRQFSKWMRLSAGI